MGDYSLQMLSKTRSSTIEGVDSRARVSTPTLSLQLELAMAVVSQNLSLCSHIITINGAIFRCD
jgi:hypothetical protein